MSQNQTSGIFEAIRIIVQSIPRGRVSTYGNVAAAVHILNSRVVGWALRNNRNPLIPCHRVVQKGGTLSPDFSLGGMAEQRRRLAADGLQIQGNQILEFDQVFFDLTRNRV
ncbi:MAG: MGMT family protein [bacterium]